MKIVRPFGGEILADVMPWQIDEKEGWVYIASDEGLYQVDGFIPTLFEFHNRRPVRSVFVSPEEGRVYAGGISEFGFFEPSTLHSLKYICLSDSLNSSDRHIGNIWGVYPTNGNLIVQGDNIILVYNLSSGKYHKIESKSKLDCSAFINGVLWMGSEDGLKLLLGKELVTAPDCESLKGKRIRKILPFHDGLLIVTSDGLWKYNNQQLSELTEYNDLMQTLGEVFTADLRGERLSLGSVSHGLAVIDLITGEHTIYDESHGFPDNTVISLKFDEEGDLIVGLQFGLAKILLNDPVESLDNTSFPIGSGFVIFQKDDNLYFGTNRGLFHSSFDKEKNKITSGIDGNAGLRGQVWGLTQLGSQLFCSHDHGLYLISPDHSSRRLGNFSGAWQVQMALGESDKAIVGSYSGLHIIRKKRGEWQYDTIVDGYLRSMYNFVQESPVVIWNDLAEEGIDRIVIDTVKNKVNSVRNFKVATDGYPLTADVWLSKIDNGIYFSTPNGIYIYNPETGEIEKEREISRLLGNPKNVKRVKKDNGRLYALTAHELIETDPAGILGTRRKSLNPSVARPIYEGNVFFSIGSDYLAYPTKNGYLFFDYSPQADSLWKNISPAANINRVYVTSEVDSVIYSRNFGDLRYEPVLKYKDNSVRIEYGNIEELDQGVLYSTRLNKEAWSTPSPILIKELEDLREGKYKFEVKAISPDGQESTDSFIFRISPPWWRSYWMLILYSLAVIAVIFILIRFEQLRVSRREIKMLEEKNAEIAQQQEEYRKEREAKDLRIESLEKEKLDKELRHKAQEVANVMMSLSHKNETLQTVKKELQNILSMLPRNNSEARRAITMLQDKVVVDLKSDDILKRVEEEFDIVHDNFMKRLRMRFTDLSNNEILLCAYLKMNLSTKEIAPMLNISPRGVETMRYRLRKKLNLEREDNLTEFLNQEVWK